MVSERKLRDTANLSWRGDAREELFGVKGSGWLDKTKVTFVVMGETTLISQRFLVKVVIPAMMTLNVYYSSPSPQEQFKLSFTFELSEISALLHYLTMTVGGFLALSPLSLRTYSKDPPIFGYAEVANASP